MPLSPEVRITWRGPRLLNVLANTLSGSVDQLAGEIARTGRLLQTTEGPIETHFSRHSYYYIGPRTSTYPLTPATGRYLSEKTGRWVPRRKLAPQPPPPGGAIVTNAADYFFFLEIKHSLLFRAMRLQTEDKTARLMRVEYRQQGGS